MARSTKTASSPRFPLRRSLRLIMKHSFRFSDLPGELRNKIYIIALRHNDKDTARTQAGALELTSGPTPTARALSAVSKRVRTESKTAFYAANTFAFTLEHSRRAHSLSASKLAEWVAAPHLGELVTPFLRGLVVGCSSNPCPRHIIIDLRHPTKPVTYLPGGCCISHSIREPDMNAWVLAVLRPGGGELKLEAKRLQAMLEGLKVSARGFAGKSAETKAREVEMLVKFRGNWFEEKVRLGLGARVGLGSPSRL